MARVLVVDDDSDDLKFIEELLQEDSHDVTCSKSADSVLNLLRSSEFDVVVLDNSLDGMGDRGMMCLQTLRKRGVGTPVILLTGHGPEGPDEEIRANVLGAFRYVRKPTSWDQPFHKLLDVVRKAIRQREFSREHVMLPGEPAPPGTSGIPLLGNSEPMVKVFEIIASFCELNDPVLIRGESGTGKELVARALFQHSPRKGRDFIPINCSLVTPEELFGHETGAFAGAEVQNRGVFEQANGGAVLLDEIGELCKDMQAAVLEVLEKGEIKRRRGLRPIKVNVRIIASSCRDLETACKEGKFLEGLYYRLKAFRIDVPPLRKRLDEVENDIEFLARHFLKEVAAAENRPVQGFNTHALEQLKKYPWPGNVRELRGTIRSAVLRCRRSQIMPEDLQLDPSEGEVAVHVRRACEAAVESGQPNVRAFLWNMLTRELALSAWGSCRPNRAKAATLLGITDRKVAEILHPYFPDDFPVPAAPDPSTIDKIRALYLFAKTFAPELKTYKQVHGWLMTDPRVEKYERALLPEDPETFARYVRRARRKEGEAGQNTPRCGREHGTSIVHLDEI